MAYGTAEQRKSWDEGDYKTRFEELRGDFAALPEKDRTSEEYRKAKSSLLDEVDVLDAELGVVRTIKDLEKRGSRDNIQGGGGLLQVGREEMRTVGEELTNNAEFRAFMDRGAHGNSPIVELRTLVTTGAGGVGGVGSSLLPVGQPFLGNVNRQRLFIRDVMSVQETGLATVPYVRELNAVSNQTTASTVNEGAVKPEAAVQFQADTAPTTVIAVNIPVTTQVMEDGPTLIGYIDGRLVYMLKLREELEILRGNGVFPDLKGILTYSTVQTQSATASDPAITIGNAIAKVVLVNGFPNAVTMNPTDSWAMKIKRAAGGSGTFDAGTPFSAAPNTIWGIDIVETLSQTAGHATVGDFRLGATLFDRKQASVKAYEQHSDYAVRNQVLIQGEERVALAVFRPDWFVDATL